VTGDIRKQLIEALDEAERQAHEARGRIVAHNHGWTRRGRVDLCDECSRRASEVTDGR